jgi:squalene synthase HpnC
MPVQAGRRDACAWQLARPPEGGGLAAAQAFCRRVAACHYENFTVATRLVPPRLRQHLANVYAYARWSDDLADEATSAEQAASDLAAWRRELEDCFAGRPGHPVFVALADTVSRARLRIEPFAHLLDAFQQDQVVTSYATRDELLGYCRRSADPVGRIVLALEGCHDAELVAMSDSICTGLQLVNFWQDVKRDRLAGRVYLPQEDMRRHDVADTMLDAAAAGPELRGLLRDEVAWARECFDAGAALAEAAPAVLRPAIGLFLAGGRAVADAIERQGFDTLSRRPRLGRWRKMRLGWAAWRATLTAGGRG